MKKALLIAAVTVMSTSAFASRARQTALANSRHLYDIQDVNMFNNGGVAEPDKAAAYGEWATLEFGQKSSTTAGSNAEGGFVRMMGQHALGAYLGAPSSTSNGYRTITQTAIGGGATLLKQENPVQLFWATKMNDMKLGASVYHSASKNKVSSTDDRKQDAMAAAVSASTDVWDAGLLFGLSNNSTQTVAAGDNKVTGKSTYKLNGGMKFDTLYAYASLSQGGAKGESPTATVMDRSDSQMLIGLVDSHKKDGTDFFYGIEYSMTTQKEDAATPAAASLGANTTKKEINAMPLFVGIEAEATSWMVLRASIKQDFNLLGLNKTKNSTNNSTDSESTGTDNTTVAGGAGFKWGKFSADAVLAASSSATGTFGFDGANFLTNGSLTYTF